VNRKEDPCRKLQGFCVFSASGCPYYSIINKTYRKRKNYKLMGITSIKFILTDEKPLNFLK